MHAHRLIFRPTVAARLLLTSLMAATPVITLAQSPFDRFEIGGQVAAATSEPFDHTHAGIGARLAWYPMVTLGIEGEITIYPKESPGPFVYSRGRTERLFGVTLGTKRLGVRPFGRFRVGVLDVREAPQPIVCTAIYPPPLTCVLALGRVLPEIDGGGGVEWFLARHPFVRLDIGTRVLRYPGPAFDNKGQLHDGTFWRTDLRIAGGGGWRF